MIQQQLDHEMEQQMIEEREALESKEAAQRNAELAMIERYLRGDYGH